MGQLICYYIFVLKRYIFRRITMILNLCLFIFFGYAGRAMYKMIKAKPKYRRKYVMNTPYGKVKVIYDEK